MLKALLLLAAVVVVALAYTVGRSMLPPRQEDTAWMRVEFDQPAEDLVEFINVVIDDKRTWVAYPTDENVVVSQNLLKMKTYQITLPKLGGQHTYAVNVCTEAGCSDFVVIKWP